MRIGDSSLGLLQASKWLDCQMLVDPTEMGSLLRELGPVRLFICGSVCPEGAGEMPIERFLENYSDYISALQSGRIPDPMGCRSQFSLAMTVDEGCLYSIPVGTAKQIIRADRPVIQMQYHQMSFSEVEKKFHPLVFGNDSISWGVQFSYPQLFKDVVNHEVHTVRETEEFPNTAIFKKLQKWSRHATVPTPFVVEGQQINVPMRLGKQCFQWINLHLQLIAKGIQVRC